MRLHTKKGENRAKKGKKIRRRIHILPSTIPACHETRTLLVQEASYVKNQRKPYYRTVFLSGTRSQGTGFFHTGAWSGIDTLTNCNKVEEDKIWKYDKIHNTGKNFFENLLV